LYTTECIIILQTIKFRIRKKLIETSCNIFPTDFLSVLLHLATATPVRLSSLFPTINVPLAKHEFGFRIILREVS